MAGIDETEPEGEQVQGEAPTEETTMLADSV
jgi:hypothetical protein